MSTTTGTTTTLTSAGVSDMTTPRDYLIEWMQTLARSTGLLSSMLFRLDIAESQRIEIAKAVRDGNATVYAMQVAIEAMAPDAPAVPIRATEDQQLATLAALTGRSEKP